VAYGGGSYDNQVLAFSFPEYYSIGDIFLYGRADYYGYLKVLKVWIGN